MMIFSFKMLLSVVSFPNFFFKEFNSPSLVTAVLPLDVANGDPPLNCRFPFVPLSYL